MGDVVFIDVDYTYPAEYLPGMIGLLEENSDVGMVAASRRLVVRRVMSRRFICVWLDYVRWVVLWSLWSI